ncbi:MAG: right-handed parallel beta-helix repeat-containing protein [Methanobacterium sp.]
MKKQIITRKTKLVIPVLLLCLAFFSCLSAVSAADNDTIYVNATGGDDNNNGTSWEYAKHSIKNATGIVNPNGTIHIADGTYTGLYNTNITIDKNMTIVGQSQTKTIINGEKINFIFTVNPGVTLTIQNLTLTNGTAANGGAINNDGSLTVTNCTFTDNKATNNYGGAINNEGTLSVTGCTFTGNTATSGGAIYNNDGSLNANNCTFTGNTAIGFYGGGAIANDGFLTVNNCTFTDNKALMAGGAILNYGSLTVNNCTFTGNTATSGGATYNYGSLSANNSTFTGNAASIGGAIYNNYGQTTTHFSRIVGNTATNSGSGIFNKVGTVDVTYNWWGSNSNPKTILNLISGNNVNTTTWVILSVNATPNRIYNTQNSTVTADFNHYTNSDGHVGELSSHIPESSITLDVPWGSFAKSRINHSVTANTINGAMTATFYANEEIINPLFNQVIVNASANNTKVNTTIIVNLMPTNLTINNTTGNKGKKATLKATLKDHYNTPLKNKIIEFYVDNVKVGEKSTDINGIATLKYYITQIGGTYNITAKFLTDSPYLASTGDGILKVNQSRVYVNVTTSKTNPAVGETIILTFKLGNNGPDPADDVVFTYVIPEGMEFISIETEPGYPRATYNSANRTITWPLGTVPIIDPWVKLNVLILNSEAFNINPSVSTSTYDPTLGGNVQQITINAIQPTKAVSSTKTLRMQETGLPVAGLILGIFAIFGGLLVPKRK